MAETTRAVFLSCFHSGGSEVSRHLVLRPRYPSMPRRPKAGAVSGEGGSGGGDGDLEAAAVAAEDEEKVVVFAVFGMTCAACAGSVEKAVKRLPGIHDAAVDVLGGRAQVVFYPAFVSVSIGYSDFALFAFVMHATFFFFCLSYGQFSDDPIDLDILSFFFFFK